MKKLIAAALIVIMALGNALVFADYHNTGKWGDEGDGTYTNPVLPYDYSDPDPQTVREYITVEDPSIYPASQRYRYIAETNDYAQDDDGEYIAQDVYYMVSSTFTKAGLGVLLRSYDMVNWETTEPDTYKSEPAQDATLHEFSGDANYGSEEHLQLGWGRRVAMKFDLSQIKSQLESGKTVDGATLDLYLNYGTTQPGATLYFAENDDWNETQVTYNNTIANGALGVSDLLHESASIDYSNDPGPILSLSGDELAAKISEEAQGDGVITLYLDYTNGDANAMGFASKDSDTMEKHPTLTVTYSGGAVSDPTASPEASAQPTATNEPTEEIEFEGVASLPLIYAPDNRISTAVLELDPDNDEEAYYAAAYALLSPRADIKGIVAKSQLSKMTSFVKAIDDSVEVYSDISEVTEPYTYRVSGGVIYNGSSIEYTASGKSVSNSQLKNNSGSLGSWLYEEYDSDGDLQLSNIDALSRITLQPYGKYDYAAEDMVSLIHLYDQTEYNDYYTAKINETEPAVKPKVIVNSDCCNEVDDEFAVLHAALRDEFDIKAFIGTQHHGGQLVGMKGYLPNLDMYELSSNTATIAYKEMLLMWGYMGAEYDSEKAERLKSITYQGSNDALTDVATADCTELDGARIILDEMKNATSDAPLYIMNFGAFTDAARAMDLAEAEGADIDYENVIVICSAGGGQSGDFNKNQDRDAFMKVCGQIETWQIASDMYNDSYTVESELWAKFGNKSRLGEMICGNLPRFMEQEKNNTWPAGNGYTLGDSPVVAALLNYLADGDVMTYESYDFVEDPTNEAGYYLSPNEDGLVKKCVSLNGRAVMYDMFDAFDEYGDNLIEAETKEYNISTKAEHGTIAVTDSEGNAITTATNGSLIKVKAESYIGYKVKDVLVNGESVNYTVLAGTNSFMMPESDVELEVVYETTTTDNVTTIDFTDYSPYIRRISGSNGFLNGTNLDSTQNSPIFSLGAADVSDLAKISLTGATNSAAYTASVYALDEETTDAEAVTSGTKLADITISATGDWNTIATFEGDAYGVEGTKYLYLSLPGGGWRGNFYSMTLEYEGSAPVTDVLDAEISASGDTVTARYAVPIAETRTLTGYFAAYNGDGILVDLKLIEALPAGDSELEFEYNSEYEYKAFIWDSAQEPVIESISY